MKHRWKRGLLLLLGLAGLAAAFIYALRSNPQWQRFDPQLFWMSFRRADWGWIAVALLAIFATYAIRAVRWLIFIRPVKREPNFWHVLSAHVAGFGLVGLMGRPGELLRPYLIARKEELPISTQLAAWVVERCFDSLVTLALVAFSVAQFQPGAFSGGSLSPQWWNSLAQGIGVVAVGVLTLLVVLRGYYGVIYAYVVSLMRSWFGRRLGPRLDSIEEVLAVFGLGLRSLRDWRSLLQCVAWSIALWLTIGFSYYAVLRSLPSGVHLSLGHAILVMGVALAGSMFQIPGIGGGTQIASVLVLTEIFQMQVEIATSASILLWFVSFLAVVPFGMLILIREGVTWAKLREIESSV